MKYKQERNGLYVLSRIDIESLVTDYLKHYAPHVLQNIAPVDIFDLMKNTVGLSIKYRAFYDSQQGIMGMIVMHDSVCIPLYNEKHCLMPIEETYGTVILSSDLLEQGNLPRLRYTAAHETGHFLMHRPYFNNLAACGVANKQAYAYRQNDHAVRRPQTPEEWMEFQANAFAAALLMPKSTFTAYTMQTLRDYSIRGDHLIIRHDQEPSIIYDIISQIASAFSVSYQATKIRMEQLGFLKITD